MRVLKYIFLLIFLLIAAAVVFIATSENTYTLSRSRYIKSPRNIVFKFVEDYSLWEIWFMSDDPSMKFSKGGNPKASVPGFTWKGESGEGSVQTSYLKSNDSLVQKIVLNDAPANAFWTFKDTTGGTIATWKIIGTLSFKDKFAAALQGGAANLVDRMYERSINSLQRVVTHEVNAYKIKIEGTSTVTLTNFLYQKLTSTSEDLNRNIRIMMSKLEFFAAKNKLALSGEPFVLYDSGLTKGTTVTFSVCLPVTEEIFIAEGSDISSGKIAGFNSVKTTLHGDYSHLNEARTAAAAYIQKYKLGFNATGKRVEIYRVRASQEKLPSKWVTEIHIPVGMAAPAPAIRTISPIVARRPTTEPAPTPTDEFDL